MLQVWDFVTAFAKPLRITPFKLWHFQSALARNARCKLLDACLLRLVQIIISDKALVAELDIPHSLVNALRVNSPTAVVDTILHELPNILLFQSDQHDDPLLHSCVQKLRHASRKEAFYKTIGPLARCRILRELVDYATMTDKVRQFLTSSVEQVHEQRKRAREEHTAMRRQYESELKQLRAKMADYKLKYGLKDPPTGSTAEHDRHSVKNGSASTPNSREGSTSRTERPKGHQRDQKTPISRRQRERGAKAILKRIEDVRKQLQLLKTVRFRRQKPSDLLQQSDDLACDDLFDYETTDPNRAYPLGTDRDRRCYWFLRGSGRIWIEDTERSDWSSLTNMKSIHVLLRWLSPHRSDEQLLKKSLRQRLAHIETEVEKERKSIELAEMEAKSLNQTSTRTTRAGKRRASQDARTKKNKSVVTFLDYENLET